MGKSKYFIDGMSLKKYCQLNNLNVNTQRNRIKQYIEEHPELSEEDAIKLCFKRCGYKYSKYNYNGQSLAKYCEENSLNYATIVDRVVAVKKKYNYTDDEATKFAIEEYTNYKYYYNEIPLVDYCKLHPEYNYSSILVFIRRLKEKNNTLSNKELVEAYFECEHNIHNSYVYKKEPLIEYCRKNKLNYNLITSYLRNINDGDLYKDLNNDEKIELAIEESKTSYTYLYFENMTLYEYCKTHNLAYVSIYNLTMKLIKQEGLELDCAIAKAISSIKRFGIKYFYRDMPLIEYCKYYSINYHLVKDKVLALIKNGYSTNDAIEETIELFEKRKYINYVNKIFSYLKKGNPNNNVIYDILIFLNIDLKNYELLMNQYHNSYYVITLIWYYYDNNYGEKLSVSHQVFHNIEHLLKKIKNTELSKIQELDIYDLLKLYKTGIYDTRYLMLIREENYIYHHIITLDKYYGLNLCHDDKKEICSEVNIKLLEIFDKYTGNNPGMFINYMLKSIKGTIRIIINKMIENKRLISLYNTIGKQDEKGSRTLIDIIASPQLDENNFSYETLEILKTLEHIEKIYVIYRYQEAMTNEEIAQYLNIEIEIIENIETVVLNKLRQDFDNKILKLI